MARARAVAMVTLAAVLALPARGTGPPAVAQGASPGTDSHASPEEQRLLSEIDASLARRRDLDQRVGELDRQVATLQRELRTAEMRLGALQTRQRSTEAEVREARLRLADAERDLRERAIAAYTGQGDAGRLATIFLRVQDVGQLAAKRSYLRLVARTQSEAVANRERLKDQEEDLLIELDNATAEAHSERNRVDTQRRRLQAERAAQDAALHEVEEEIVRRNDLVQEMVARQGEFDTQVAALARESAAVTETLRARQESQQQQPSSSPPPSGGRLASPIPGAAVTSTFGQRVHPIYGTVRMHTGIDLAARAGTPIRAAADGVVASAGWLGGYGLATIIDHGGPLATLYGHQSELDVSTGDRVTRGQVIGRVGCTGACTGPHLHYEVRIGGNPVDPAPYL